METFADYILSEKDWIKKMEIMHYLQIKMVAIYLLQKMKAVIKLYRKITY